MQIDVQQVPTLSCHGYELEDQYRFQPLDIVYENSGNPHGHVALGVVLAGPISIPSFEDGCASGFASKPLDIKNPDEWKMGWWAYIVFDLSRQITTLAGARSLHKLEENPMSGYIPFDHGTAQLRVPLGLIELADRFYVNNDETSHLQIFIKQSKQAGDI